MPRLHAALVVRLTACLLVCLTAGACRSRAPEAAPDAGAPASGPLKIWVTKTGVIELDGKPSDVEHVGDALAALAKRKGTVLYGQDQPEGQPHPNIARVLKLVMNAGVDFRFTLDHQFSQFAQGLTRDHGEAMSH